MATPQATTAHGSVTTGPRAVSSPVKLLTAGEVAAMLRVKESWVWERTRDRCPEDQRIPYRRLPGGRYVRFVESEIHEWIANGFKVKKRGKQ
ncbi:MAG TPA: helix-turn-helix domain-containing protein [Candidatus Angelobacter sp.]|nr:helix-turn-helix domain-containing protein [Candidatus Angelobacter sp.]